MANALSDNNAKNAKNTENAENNKNNKNEPFKYIYKIKKKPASNTITKRVVRRLFGPNKYIKTLPIPVMINDYNYRINGVNWVN